MAHPVTTPLRVVRRWVKSGDQVELAESVLRFAGNGYLDVLLDLGDLWAIGVMVSVRLSALWANRFHFRNRIMEVGNGNACWTWLEP